MVLDPPVVHLRPGGGWRDGAAHALTAAGVIVHTAWCMTPCSPLLLLQALPHTDQPIFHRKDEGALIFQSILSNSTASGERAELVAADGT